MAKKPVANIGVDLTARIAGFEANMNKATKKLNSSQAKMNRSLARIENGFAAVGKKVAAFAGIAGIGLAVRGLDSLARDAIKFGDDLDDMSQRLGVSVERLQELRFAAKRSGVDIEKLDSGLARFAKGIGEASFGTGTLVEILKKSDPDLLKKLIDAPNVTAAIDLILAKIRELPKETDKIALAAAAFGRNTGAAFGVIAKDIDPLTEELRKMGGVLSDELAKKAGIADDAMTNLDTVLKAKLSATVLDNIEGFVAFQKAINAVEIAAVKASAAVGNFFNGRFSFGPPLDETDTLELTKELTKERGRLAAMQERLNNIEEKNPLLRFGAAPLAGILKTEIARAQDNIQLLQKLLARAEFAKAAAGLKKQEITGPSVPSVNAVTPEIKIPPTPSLKPVKVDIEETTSLSERLAAALANVGIEGEDVGRSLSGAFAAAIVFGERLDKTLARLAQRLAFEALSNLILKSLPAAFGGGGAPGMAGGGRISGPTLVGERGPEIIVPQRPATVINASDSRRALGGASVTVQLTQHNNFAGGAATQDDVRLMGQITREAAIAGTLQALRRPRFA